jgi:hypothetical protein
MHIIYIFMAVVFGASAEKGFCVRLFEFLKQLINIF